MIHVGEMTSTEAIVKLKLIMSESRVCVHILRGASLNTRSECIVIQGSEKIVHESSTHPSDRAYLTMKLVQSTVKRPLSKNSN